MEHCANLYKNMIASQSVKLMAIYEFIRSGPTTPPSNVTNLSNGVNVVEKDCFHLIEQALKKLYNSIRVVDKIVTHAKIEKFLREKIVQKLDISLVECESAENKEYDKVYKIVSTSKCLEEFRREKRNEALPAKSVRANPFISNIKVDDESSSTTTSNSTQQMPLSKLNDLDLKILAYSEIVLLLFERLVADENPVFCKALPFFYPRICEYLRIAPNFRARQVIADIFERIPENYENFKVL
uniref:Uncharacterized protein n=1 Tax=Acrobeloides nanus TaxID=290746 RepID=A0A914D2Z5_9BILA